MRSILKIIEYLIGRILYRLRGFDDQLFRKSPAFAEHPEPTIILTSPDCGPSGARLSHDYSHFGSARIPQLSWSEGSLPSTTNELLLLVEDPDAPLGHPIVHGIYILIPPDTTSFGPKDLELIEEIDGVKRIASGWRVGKNRRGTVYIPPRPPLGHGPHRYLFKLVALSEKLDPQKLSSVPDKKEIEQAIEGKVVGWGLWEATYESTWDRDQTKR